MVNVENTQEYSSARLAAVKVISHVLNDQGSLSSQLAKHNDSISQDQLPLVKEMCFGVCRHFPVLNSLALNLLNHPFEEKDLDLYAVILIGFYQLGYMNTPDHAAINESVETCRQLDKDWATKLINAVLRNYQRENQALVESLYHLPSVQFNMPKWLVKRFKKYWPEEFENIIEASNNHPPMCLRVNQARVSRETYLEKLKLNGIRATAGKVSESAIYLEKAVRVVDLPGFEHGEVSVQDESAQLAAHILLPKQGDIILDACAAPGGKTCHLIEMAPENQITAVELEAWRIEKIESNLERLGYQAHVICSDAAKIENWWEGEAFDKILLDVPCSATGVIRRNPDIKINRKPTDVSALVDIQREILKQVWKTLKPGGHLLYATCSLMKEENEDQVAYFLAQQADAKELDLNAINPALQLEGEQGKKVLHGVQLFPKKDQQDGFYYCLLQKKLA
ncbi:16S rRNA (cytosine(967)-C(5))-methyltransferase RsmB [Marinomonas epiphytica]